MRNTRSEIGSKQIYIIFSLSNFTRQKQNCRVSLWSSYTLDARNSLEPIKRCEQKQTRAVHKRNAILNGDASVRSLHRQKDTHTHTQILPHAPFCQRCRHCHTAAPTQCEYTYLYSFQIQISLWHCIFSNNEFHLVAKFLYIVRRVNPLSVNLSSG